MDGVSKNLPARRRDDALSGQSGDASAHYVALLIDQLVELGMTRNAATEALSQKAIGTNGSVKRDARIPLNHVSDMFDAAEAQLKDPLIGLRVGGSIRIGNYGATGSVYAFAANLEDVVGLNARYQRLAIDMGRISFVSLEDGGARMIFEPYYADHDRFRHLTGMLMGAYGTTYRWLSWGSGHGLQSVALPMPEPALESTDANDTVEALLTRIFGCPVSFGSARGYLEFDDVAVSQPLATANPEKRAIAVARMEAMLGAASASESFVTAMRSAIRGGLDAGALNAALLAERMDLSERALRDQMKAVGLTYREELDRVRQSICEEAFDRGESFAQIATQLRYNDQAAFNRAFRRWHGTSPSAWAAERSKADK